MEILYKNLKSLVVYGVSVDFRVLLSEGRLVCRLSAPEQLTNGVYGQHVFNYPTVTYNGETKSFGTRSVYVAEASFDYTEEVKTVTLSITGVASSKQIYYDNLFYGKNFPVTFRTGAPAVTCTFETPSVHEDYRNRIRWTLTSPEGYPCALTELLYYEKGGNDRSYTCTRLFSGRNESGQYVHTLPELTAGKQCYYRLAYCSYRSTTAWDEDFLTYGEYTTEVFTVGETKKYPAPPVRISFNRPAPGGYAHVAWSNSADGFNERVEYELERQVNGGEWRLVYRGASISFSDKVTNADAETVAYRVRTVNEDGYQSEWKESETLTVIKSNLFVKSGGVIRPATQVYIGGRGEVGAIAFVGLG